jgi:Glycosyltransferase family 87
VPSVTSSSARAATFSLSPRGRQVIRGILVSASILGLLIGLGALRLHLTTDPLADVHAYYDAGARLNAGQPLYVQPGTTNDPAFYRYPPLLAILFRPLALLPFDAAAALWMLVLGVAIALTVWRLHPGPPVLLAIGMLAMPILWTLAIGQAQALVTLLLAFGTPFGVAAAGYLKLTPWLAAIYWLGRRDLRAIRKFVAWTVGLGLLQLALAPQATIDYLGFPSLTQVGDVVNLSPYAVSPLLWAVAVLMGGLLALRLAPTGWGWAAAVALAVGATPRLLAYQLSTLLAGFGGPGADATADAAE